MKKVLIVLLAATMSMSMLTGCGGKNGAETNPTKKEESAAQPVQTEKAAKTEKKQVTMWFWGTADFQREAMEKNLIEVYNNSQDEYELVVEFRNSVDNDVNVAVSANQGPDIVYGSGPSFVAALASAGKLANLDEYSEKYGWNDKILKPMYDACSYSDSLYSVPGSLNTLGIFYNKKVLEENNWKVPTTIAELEKIMDEAMAKGMYASVTGAQGWRPTNENYVSLLLTHMAGPDAVYKALNGEESWASPKIVESMEKLNEWYQKGYLAGQDYFNLDFNAATQLLIDGKSPFFIGPTLVFQFVRKVSTSEQAENIGFTAFPNFDQSLNSPLYTLGTVCSFSINQASEHKDAAAAVLNVMMSPEFVVGMTETWPGYWGMPLKNLDEADTSKLTGLSKTYMDACMNISSAVDSGNFGYFAGTFFPPSTLTRFYDIDTVWVGDETAEELMKSIDKTFQEEKSKGLVPPIPMPAK